MSEKEEIKSGQKHILRKIVYFLLAIMMVFLPFVALLPTILSLNPVRRMVLNRAKVAIEGSININSWSFGWFSGATLEGIEFNDGKGMLAKAKRISMSSGLIRLLGSPMNLGSVLVLEPDFSILMKKTVQDEKPVTKSQPIRVGLNIKGLFKVQDGRIMITTEKGSKPLVLEKINMDLAIEDLQKPLALNFSAIQGKNTGAIRGKASVKIFEKGEFNIQNISGDIYIDVEEFELSPSSEIAGYFVELPRANGKLNSNISGNVDTIEHIDMKGQVRLNSLMLYNGPLGNDTPSFDTVNLEFNLNRDGRSLEIKTFNFDAPFAKVISSGGLRDEGKKYPSGTITLNGNLDVARIFSEFSHTLKIKEGLRMSSGNIVFNANIKSVENVMDFASNVEISNLKGSQGAQDFALDSPISLSTRALITEKRLKLDHFKLSSAFANASGKGNLDDLEISLSVDLDKTKNELGKFVDLGKFHVLGTMNANARISGQNKLNKDCNLGININNLFLKGLTPRPIKQEFIQADLTGQLNISEDGKPQDINDLAAKVKSSILTADLGIQSLKIPSRETTSSLQNLTTTANIDLDKAMKFAGDVGVIKPGLDIRGNLKLDCKAGMEKGMIDLSSVMADITNLILKVNGKKLSEPLLRVKSEANVNLSTRQATVQDLSASFSAGKIIIPTAKVHDWSKLLPSLEFKAAIDVTLDKIVSTLSEFKPIPEGSKISGFAKCDLSGLPKEGDQGIRLALVLDNLTFKSKSGQVFKEPMSKLGADTRINMVKDMVILDSLEFETTLLNLRGSGKLTDLKKTKELDVSGKLECDFARLGEIVAILSGKKIDIEGKKTQNFSIRTSLSEKTWPDILRKTNASAGLYVKRLKSFGVEAHDLVTQLVVKDSQAKVDLKTKVNEGDMNIIPVVDVRGERPVLIIADNSKVLNDVKLTDEMASDLLALIHPIFRECTIMGGQIGMLLKNCRVPIDKDMKKDMVISGEVELKEVTLMPSGILNSILNIIKLEQTPARISDQTVSFTCRDGHIEPSPLTIKSDRYKIIFSGSVTYDGMVNYVAEVPVTEKMVNQDVYKYVKDARLKVLIEGPVSKPKISRKSLDDSLSNLVKEAAKNLIKEKGTDLLKQLFKNR